MERYVQHGIGEALFRETPAHRRPLIVSGLPSNVGTLSGTPQYWNAGARCWLLVDAQLDEVQRRTFQVDFDPTDVPRDRFILAGDAWQKCRAGRADPALFGLSIIKEQGLWWVAQNLIRDLASLNRVEMLPWDVWGMMPRLVSSRRKTERSLIASPRSPWAATTPLQRFRKSIMIRASKSRAGFLMPTERSRKNWLSDT